MRSLNVLFLSSYAPHTYHFSFSLQSIKSVQYKFPIFFILKLSSSWGMLLILVFLLFFFLYKLHYKFSFILQTKIFFFNFLNQIIYFSYIKNLNFCRFFSFILFYLFKFYFGKIQFNQSDQLNLCAIRFLKVLLMMI